MFELVAAIAAMVGAEAPPPVTLEDLEAMPPLSEIDRQIKLADDHIEYLDLRRQTHGDGWGLKEWRAEAVELRRNWSLLLAARGFNSDEICWWREGRLEYLQLLRQRIGCANYRQGYLPPSVPSWRFTSRD